MDNFQAGLAAVTPTGPACGGEGSPARDAEGIPAKTSAPAAQMLEEGRATELQEDVGRSLPKTFPCSSLMEESEALAALGSWALVCGFEIASAWPEPGVAGGRWSWAVALVAFLLASLLLAADRLLTLGHGRRTRARDGALARFLQSRPWALASHVMLLGGCFLWLILHAAAQRGPQVCVGVATFWTLLSLAAVRLATCAREAATERCKAAGHDILHGKPEQRNFPLPAKQIAGSPGALWTASGDHSVNDVNAQCHQEAPILVSRSGNVQGCEEVGAARGTPPGMPGQVQPPGVADTATKAVLPSSENSQTSASLVRQSSDSWRQQQKWKPLFPESTDESPVSPAPVRPPEPADASRSTPPLPNTACPTLAIGRAPTLPTSPASSKTCNEEKGASPTNFKAPIVRPAVGTSLFNDPWQLQASGSGRWDNGEDLPLRIRSTGTGPPKYGSGSKLQSRSKTNSEPEVSASLETVAYAPTSALGAVTSAPGGPPTDSLDVAFSEESHHTGATIAAASDALAMSPVSATAAAVAPLLVTAGAGDSAAGSPRSASEEEVCSTLDAVAGPISGLSQIKRGSHSAENSGLSNASGKSSPAKSETSCKGSDSSETRRRVSFRDEDISTHSSPSSAKSVTRAVTRLSLVIPSSTSNQLAIPGHGGRKKANSICVAVVHDKNKDASEDTEVGVHGSKSPGASPDRRRSAGDEVASLERPATLSRELAAPPEATPKEEKKVEAPVAVSAAFVPDPGAVTGAGKQVQEPTGLKTPPKEDLDDNPPPDAGIIDPEVLRKAILSNIRRRPVAIGDPIGGGRIEELHETLHRPEDEKQTEAADYGGSSEGHPDSLTADAEPHEQGLGQLDILNGDGMNADSFQRLREHYHAAEAELTVMPSLPAGMGGAGGLSLWPKLLNSIQHSMQHSRNGSRRHTFLANDQASSSRRGSNVDASSSRRSSWQSKQPSRDGSRMGSQQGSRNGSRRGSRAGSRAGSRRNSRQASRSNSFSVAREPDPTQRRNSLMLPNTPSSFNESDSGDDQAQAPHAAGDDSDKDAGGKGPAQKRRKRDSLLQIGGPLPPVIQMAPVLEDVSEDRNMSGTPTRKEGAPRFTAPAAVISCVLPQVVKGTAQNDVPSGDASAGSPGLSNDPSLQASPCESPVPKVAPVSLTINGVEVAEGHVTPQGSRRASVKNVQEHRDKHIEETESDRGAEENEEEEEATAKAEAERLKKTLEMNPGEMTLKDLFLRDSGVGDVSLESLRRVAADWARGKEAENRWKQQDDDSSEEDSNSDDEDSSDSDDDDDSDEEDEPPMMDPILKELNLNPAMVSEALKMLMMLNDGFKAHHCNCKENGPHTCMSPAVSQLASTVHTALNSLGTSLSASLAGSVAVSRRGSVHHTRRASLADGLKAWNKRRSSKENQEKKHSIPTSDDFHGTNSDEASRPQLLKANSKEKILRKNTDSVSDGASPTTSPDSRENSPSMSPHGSPANRKTRKSLEALAEELPPPQPYAGEADKGHGSPESRLTGKRASAMLGARGWKVGGNSHVHFSGADPCGNAMCCNTADAGAGPSSTQG